MFDSDAVWIGFDTYISATMSGQKDLIFQVGLGTHGGITGSLEIKGLVTFILKLNDDSGRQHTISIPILLYLPDL